MKFQFPARRILSLALVMIAAQTTQAKERHHRLDAQSPTQQRQVLTWSVDREIVGVRVEVLEGTPIINTVKVMPGQDFRVGARIAKGTHWEGRLDRPATPTRVVVSTDVARGSSIRVVLITSDAQPAPKPPAASEGRVQRPSRRTQALEWQVNEEIRGFEIVVLEGRPIINTIKVVGVQDFTIGAYIDAGSSVKREFEQPRQVGRIRVSVDRADASALELRLIK
ncbi:MAG: hypothetical protein JJU29_02490 [Verrucomicrobia bacterium]|nr:hypothetical protein [Verrucomicrobiota bacterium]MCH8511205.1 hypothetical protein [Kiritimatiellia bacterium]